MVGRISWLFWPLVGRRFVVTWLALRGWQIDGAEFSHPDHWMPLEGDLQTLTTVRAHAFAARRIILGLKSSGAVGTAVVDHGRYSRKSSRLLL